LVAASANVRRSHGLDAPVSASHQDTKMADAAQRSLVDGILT
jgi:hypothetical protein